MDVDFKYNDFVALQMESGVDEKLLIGIFYRSPNNSPELDEFFYVIEFDILELGLDAPVNPSHPTDYIGEEI